MKNIVLFLLLLFVYLAASVYDRRSIDGHRVVVKLDMNDVVATQKTELRLKIDYQGLLENSDERTVRDGNYEITFRIYDSEESNVCVWKEVHEVEISEGMLNCNIEAVDKYDLPTDRQYWLSVSVGDKELLRTGLK